MNKFLSRISHRATGFLLVSSILYFLMTACGQQTSKQEPEWRSIFNGKDLTGWTPKFVGYPLGENYKNTFRVEDGLLKVRYDKWEDFNEVFGHIFYEKELSKYRIRVEYRFVGDQVKEGPGWAYRNNGIMLHCQDPKTMSIDQDFPVSIEGQLLGGNGEDPEPLPMYVHPELM
ncbi:MAG: DUF1080 domain-containing protein [Bacteroidota bacterium]